MRVSDPDSVRYLALRECSVSVANPALQNSPDASILAAPNHRNFVFAVVHFVAPVCVAVPLVYDKKRAGRKVFENFLKTF